VKTPLHTLGERFELLFTDKRFSHDGLFPHGGILHEAGHSPPLLWPLP
jgi:hypothetical protein